MFTLSIMGGMGLTTANHFAKNQQPRCTLKKKPNLTFNGITALHPAGFHSHFPSLPARNMRL